MGMPKGWRKQKLATGPMRSNGNASAMTFEEFLEDQRIRVMNALRPPVPDLYTEAYDAQYTLMRRNENMTRRQIYRSCEQTVRGRV